MQCYFVTSTLLLISLFSHFGFYISQFFVRNEKKEKIDCVVIKNFLSLNNH